MCGIIAGIAKNNIVEILIQGLDRLEYRGYDSAGLVVLDDKNSFKRHRVIGKVDVLKKTCKNKPIAGNLGIAHTRWATHGEPSSKNAHPHICNDRLALVHNGIVENYEHLRGGQNNYRFTSDTDTETLVHQIDLRYLEEKDLLRATLKTCADIEGSYAFVALDKKTKKLVATRQGSPLILAISNNNCCFVASDVAALIGVCDRFVFLKEGDIAIISDNGYELYDLNANKITREEVKSDLNVSAISKQGFSHYMLKEIFEQPKVIEQTLDGRLSKKGINSGLLGYKNDEILKKITQIQIIACGTSYHAGLVAKYWIEDLLQIPCQVEIASEFRYRNPVILDNTLVITISQSGETADTITALKSIKGKSSKYHSLTICNVAESSLVRMSDLVLFTFAGKEIGVASTKAFTTQLVALMLLILTIAKVKNIKIKNEKKLIDELNRLPALVEDVLNASVEVEDLAEKIASKDNALFLGRGLEYPIALEGALKLKEISYIHAESYPAGELKHGPLALIDDKMPVIAVAPNNTLLKKLKSNIQEVKARGGELFVFADPSAYTKEQIKDFDNFHLINIAKVSDILSPIVFVIPLQLLSYYVALIRGTDIDQPRNLAKSVTVE